MKKVIAITGGIGSGKSAVLSIVKGFNYHVISADDVNRRLLNDDKYLQILKLHFPNAFVDERFEKKILSDIIFHDKERRLELNSIAHKRIKAIIKDEIDMSKDDLIFVEVPILVESGMVDLFDEIIVVTAPRDVKIARVMKRDNISHDDVLYRMRSQLDDMQLLKIATYVIDNSSTFEDLKIKVADVIDKII